MSTDMVQIAADIREAHTAASRAATSALEHARRAGELLQQAKAGLPHGAWLRWLGEHCPDISPRLAQRYMLVAARWPEIDAANTTRVSYLPIRQALALLAEPTPREPDASLGLDGPVGRFHESRLNLDAAIRDCLDAQRDLANAFDEWPTAAMLEEWRTLLTPEGFKNEYVRQLQQYIDSQTDPDVAARWSERLEAAVEEIYRRQLSGTSDSWPPPNVAVTAGGRRGVEIWTAWIHPYTDPTFVFVSVICDAPGGATVEGTRRPIRRDHARCLLSRICPAALGEWIETVDPQPWTYNQAMYPTLEAWQAERSAELAGGE